MSNSEQRLIRQLWHGPRLGSELVGNPRTNRWAALQLQKKGKLTRKYGEYSLTIPRMIKFLDCAPKVFL